MRVLHTIHSLDPRHGGPPLIAASLAAAQARSGHDVILLTEPLTDDVRETLARQVPGLDKVRIVAAPPVGGRGLLLGSKPIVETLDRLGGIDVIHLHNVWDPLVCVVASWARQRGVPYAVLLNGMLHPWSLAQSRLKKKIAFALVYRRMLEGAAFLHLGNNDETAAIRPLGLEAPCEVIPNGIWPEIFDRHVDALPSFVEGGRYVLFLSRLHYKKGTDVLLDAFVKIAPTFPDVRLVIAGNDQGELPAIEARLAEAGLGDRVVVPGPLYGDEKLAALLNAWCFCLPSRQEGFPVAVLEALAAGCPCIITRECNVPEVQSAGAGECVAVDADAVSAALGRTLGDDALRERQATAAAALARDRFTWDRAAAAAIEAYERYRS